MICHNFTTTIWVDWFKGSCFPLISIFVSTITKHLRTTSLKQLEARLADQFDHTFLANADDPLLSTWRQPHDQGALDLRVMANVGMEASAELVWGWANELLHGRDSGRSCCWKVEARENEKNAACFEALPGWFKP